MSAQNQRRAFVILSIICFLPFFQHASPKYFNGGSEEHVTIYARENLHSDKKLPRQAVIIKRPHAQGTVVICHGYTANKYDVSFTHMMFQNYNSIAFDFRAHGEATADQVCTLGCHEIYEVIAAVDYVRQDNDLKHLPVYGYGFSMGAVAALRAQAQDENLFDALVLDCPFDSLDDLLDRGLKKFKFNFFGYEWSLPGSSYVKGYAYSPYVQSYLRSMLKLFANMNSIDIPTDVSPIYPKEAIKNVDVPCFFIACVNDDKAPEEAVRAVYDGAKGFKRLWITEGRRHFDSIFFKFSEYFYRVRRFLEKSTDGSLYAKVTKKIIRDNGRTIKPDHGKIPDQKTAVTAIHMPRKTDVVHNTTAYKIPESEIHNEKEADEPIGVHRQQEQGSQ